MTDRLKDEESSEGRREMAHIRVLFCEYPGAEMKHNSTWSTLKDAQKRARELQDKGFGTEIKPSGSLPSAVGADIIKQVDDPEPCGKRIYDADDGEKLNCGKPKGCAIGTGHFIPIRS